MAGSFRISLPSSCSRSSFSLNKDPAFFLGEAWILGSRCCCNLSLLEILRARSYCWIFSYIICSDSARQRPTSPRSRSKVSMPSLRSRSKAAATSPRSEICRRQGGGAQIQVRRGLVLGIKSLSMETLSMESTQGINEFLTEIDMILYGRHPNHVRLIGCFIEDANRMLVYEYLENNSLASALLGPRNNCIHMDWSKRAVICYTLYRNYAKEGEALRLRLAPRKGRRCGSMAERFQRT